MAKFQDPNTGIVQEVGNPGLNPDLIAGQTQVSDDTPLGAGVITGSSLSNDPPINFQTSNETPPDGSSAFASLGPEGEKAQADTEEITDWNKLLLGESSFRSGLEEEADIGGLTAIQTDLEARLTGLRNESLAIPLQFQQSIEGQGVTKGGLAPIQTGALRENAIKSLSVASQLEASRGNLATALDLVDRAVANKYDPIREQIKVKLANLELILASPAYTNEEKNRAENQKQEQEAKAAALEKAAADELSRKELLAKVTAQGLPDNILAQVEGAKSYDEAFKIAMPAMAAAARTDKKAAQTLLDLQAANIQSQIDTRAEDLRLKAVALGKAKAAEVAAGEKALEEEKQVTKDDAERALGIQTLIGDLKTHEKLKLATGFTSLFPTLPGFATRDFNLTHAQLKDTLTKDGLKALRGLGAMSERELALIEKSVSKLSLDLPEDEYVAELNKISANLQSTFDKALELGVLDPIDVAISFGLDASDVSDLSTMGLFDTAGTTSSFNPSSFY